MARDANEILRQQIGQLIFSLAELQATNEAQKDEIELLRKNQKKVPIMKESK
jgi:hypothetical protein